VRKKFKSITVLNTDVKTSERNVQQGKGANTPADTEMNDKNQLEGSELFSFFTANIIREKKVFTR
jgi:hypothetical protein